MAETVKMPWIEQNEYTLPPKQWMVMDVRGAGTGQVLADLPRDKPVALSPTHACFHRFSVEEGQPVGPGQVVAEVLVNNVVLDIYSLGYGVVSGLVSYDEYDVVKPGDVLLHITAREDHSSRKTGLHPKASSAMRFARFGR